MRRERGFTLIELLVVFGIMALVIGLVPVAYERMRESSQYRDVVRTMYSQLRLARVQAATQAQETRFTLDLSARQYGVEGASLKALPEGIELRVTAANQEIAPDGQVSIRFLPSGGATGGSIEILRASGAGTRLRVDWLSGRVSQEALLP
jgi:general secretion pathway protein H